MTFPTDEFETPYWQQGALVAGVDEVGRGPLAGPVVAAAVILDPSAVPEGLNDSKKLGKKKRAVLAEVLSHCAHVSIAEASVAEIDALNILHASMLAMERAVAGLPERPDHVLIDGNKIPKSLNIPATALVKGDNRSVSVAAASIVAKINRDHLMRDLAQQYPGYGWETNVGYPTKRHISALRELGVTPVHRRSFRPVHNILYQEDFIRD